MVNTSNKHDCTRSYRSHTVAHVECTEQKLTVQQFAFAYYVCMSWAAICSTVWYWDHNTLQCPGKTVHHNHPHCTCDKHASTFTVCIIIRQICTQHNGKNPLMCWIKTLASRVVQPVYCIYMYYRCEYCTAKQAIVIRKYHRSCTKTTQD